MSGFAEEMAEYEEAYTQAEAMEKTTVFSDGRHQGVVTVSRIERSEKYPDQWQWVLRVRGIDSKTKKPATIGKWTNLPPEDEAKNKYLKTDRKLLDDPDWDGSLASLQAACEDERFIGLLLDFGVKTKAGTNDRDYTNMYLNGTMGKVEDLDEYLQSHGLGDASSGDPGAEASPEYGDDDIPF